MRSEPAGRLLMAGTRVTQVALSVGYDSLNAFTRSFRSTTGILPSQYARGQGGVVRAPDSS